MRATPPLQESCAVMPAQSPEFNVPERLLSRSGYFRLEHDAWQGALHRLCRRAGQIQHQ